jgi:hypothetical protein
MLRYSYVYLPVVTRVNCGRGSAGIAAADTAQLTKGRLRKRKGGKEREKRKGGKKNKECNNVTE